MKWEGGLSGQWEQEEAKQLRSHEGQGETQIKQELPLWCQQPLTWQWEEKQEEEAAKHQEEFEKLPEEVEKVPAGDEKALEDRGR